MLRITIPVLLALAACGPHKTAPTQPRSVAPAPTEPDPALDYATVPVSEDLEITLCDGKSKATLFEGEVRSRENGQAIADLLMAQWVLDHPDRDWETKEREAHELQPSADNTALIADGDADRTYGKFSRRDVEMWKRETERVALMGSRVFHNAEELGSTVGVSCDMCHPHAANTHPETYPKFQTQLGRVVLLRDMINWCVQHPVRGEALDPEDPRMRALEAYIYAQRRGAVLEYGKH